MLQKVDPRVFRQRSFDKPLRFSSLWSFPMFLGKPFPGVRPPALASKHRHSSMLLRSSGFGGVHAGVDRFARVCSGNHGCYKDPPWDAWSHYFCCLLPAELAAVRFSREHHTKLTDIDPSCK